jgi:hypothetical protein
VGSSSKKKHQNLNTDEEEDRGLLNSALPSSVAVLPVETHSLQLLKPTEVLNTILALKEVAIFTTELQDAASRVKQIIRENTQKSISASATYRGRCRV